MISPTNEKSLLRRRYRSLRKELSSTRKLEAVRECCAALMSSFSLEKRVLSFYSVDSEIDLSIYNQWLIDHQRLCLPRVDCGILRIFCVDCCFSQCIQSSNTGFYEPDPEQCEEIPLEMLEGILVPGLVFDAEGYRLGYGKGHYDRFLAQKVGLQILAIGVGYREQLYPWALPREIHDHKVDQLLLF